MFGLIDGYLGFYSFSELNSPRYKTNRRQEWRRFRSITYERPGCNCRNKQVGQRLWRQKSHKCNSLMQKRFKNDHYFHHN